MTPIRRAPTPSTSSRARRAATRPDPVPPPTRPQPAVAGGLATRARARRWRSRIVAVLGGAALFLSGYSLGRQAASEPGTPICEAEAFQPVLGHVPHDHRALRRRRGRPRGPHPGRDQGDDRRPRRPVLLVPDLRGVPPQPAGDQRPVRGHRRRDRDAGPRRRAGLRDARPRLPARDRRRRSTGSPAEKAGLLAGDLVLAIDGDPLDGLTVDAARDRIRGPKGSVVTLTIQRGDAAPFDLGDHPRHHPAQEVDSQGPRRRDGRVRPADRLLRHAADAAARGARRARGGRPDGADPRPARQPGRVRDRRPDGREPVHRLGRRSSGSRTPRRPARDRRACPAASRPTRRCGSSASSTAAAPRRARSWPHDQFIGYPLRRNGCSAENRVGNRPTKPLNRQPGLDV